MIPCFCRTPPMQLENRMLGMKEGAEVGPTSFSKSLGRRILGDPRGILPLFPYFTNSELVPVLLRIPTSGFRREEDGRRRGSDDDALDVRSVEMKFSDDPIAH